jgi:hypothetical protein
MTNPGNSSIVTGLFTDRDNAERWKARRCRTSRST